MRNVRTTLHTWGQMADRTHLPGHWFDLAELEPVLRGTRSPGFPGRIVMASLVLGMGEWPPSEGGFSPLGPEGLRPLGSLS